MFSEQFSITWCPDLLQSDLKTLNSEQVTVFEKDKNLRNNLVFSFTVTLKAKIVLFYLH